MYLPLAAVYLMYRCGHRWRGTMSAPNPSVLMLPGLVTSIFCSLVVILDVSDPVFRAMTRYLVDYR